MWEEGGNVKLVKFRLTTIQQLEWRNGRKIPSNEVYTAPEIFNGADYTVASDIWSVGCMLYELVTLNNGFSAISQHQDVSNIIKNGLFAAIPSSYSSVLKQVINAFLMMEPENRPDTAQVLEISEIRDARKRLLNRVELAMGLAQESLKLTHSTMKEQTSRIAELEKGAAETSKLYSKSLRTAEERRIIDTEYRALTAAQIEIQAKKIKELEEKLKVKEAEFGALRTGLLASLKANYKEMGRLLTQKV